MYEFTKTETGWVVHWGPLPVEKTREAGVEEVQKQVQTIVTRDMIVESQHELQQLPQWIQP